MIQDMHSCQSMDWNKPEHTCYFTGEFLGALGAQDENTTGCGTEYVHFDLVSFSANKVYGVTLHVGWKSACKCISNDFVLKQIWQMTWR